MKKISYLLSIAMMAAAGLFCACSSSDDDVAEATADETSASEGTAYMTVNMQVASGSSTRADENTEVDGANFENNVEAKNSVFLFYDASGAYVGYGTFSGDWSADGTSSNGNGIEKTITIQHTGELSSIVYCLVVCNYGTSEDYVSSLRKNYNDATYTDLEKTKLLTTKQAAADPVTSDETTTYTNFLMTSALRYADGSLQSLEVDVSKYIKESTSDASSNPVSIYIERVTAKANIAAADDSSLKTETAGYIAQSVSGTDTSYYCKLPMTYVYKSGTSTYSSSSVKINISGWAIDAYNSSSNLFKQLPTSYTTPTTTTYWYHSSSRQIYWASDANYSSDAVKTDVNYLDYSDVNKTSTETMYLFENTACYDVQAGTTYNVAGTTAVTPAVLVTAAIEITPGTGDDEATTVDAVSSEDLYISTGIIYDLDAVKNAVAEALNNANYVLASSESDTETSSITADDITLALEVIEGTVTVKAVSSSSSSSSSVTGKTSTGLATTQTKSLYLKSDDGLTDKSSDAASIITEVANGTTIINYTESSTSSNLKYYKSGHCYYMVPIEQMSSANSGLTNSSNTAIAMNGVVRNHWYDITLNTISGIGRAITDDNDDITIIPEEETVGYLSCTINILSWNKKTQSIDF